MSSVPGSEHRFTEAETAAREGVSFDGPTRSDNVDVSDVSVGQLVGEVVQDLSTLMRQELDLAKSEIREEAKKGGKGAGMLGGAGLAGWMFLLFASLTLMWALDHVMDIVWAALIVAVLWAIVVAVLYSMGRRSLREMSPMPRRTVETLKEDVEWAKDRTK